MAALLRRCQIAPLRQLFSGVVAACVFVMLVLGGSAAARPVFHGLAAMWVAAVMALHLRRRAVGQPAGADPSGPVRIWRRLSGWLDVAAFNAALAVVLGEIALRGYAAWAGVSPLVADSLEAYKLAPHRDYGNVRANAHGYPGREFRVERISGVFRVAALGDSFAVGPAVRYADNYLQLLERKLPRTEVFNFGVSGTGPREYLTILRNEVWTYHPDLVLVSVFVGNDVTETLATPRRMDPRQSALGLFAIRTWRLWRRRADAGAGPSPSEPAVAPTPALSESAFREVEARRLAVCLADPPAGMERKWRQCLAALDGIVAECRRRHVAVGFVLIPDNFQVDPAVLRLAVADGGHQPADVDITLPQRRLGAFLRGRGVPCLDLLEAFRGCANGYAPRDTHWNARGNQVAAGAIVRWLAATPGLVPGPSPLAAAASATAQAAGGAD